MATLRGPSPIGGALSAFLDAYQRGRGQWREEEQLGRQNALLALQMSEIVRKQQEEQGLSAALSRLPTVPRDVFALPEIPGAPETMLSTVPGAEFPETVPGPPMVSPPGLPTPGVSMSGLTADTLARQLGTREAGLILGSERGRAAFTAMGGETPEKFEKRKRVEEAQQKWRHHARAAQEADAAGEPVKALDEEAAGLAALIDGTDNPAAQADLAGKLRRAREDRKKLTDDATQHRLAREDGPRIAGAMKLLREAATTSEPGNRVSEALDLLGQVEGDRGRQQVGPIINTIVGKSLDASAVAGADRAFIDANRLYVDRLKAEHGKTFDLPREKRVAAIRAVATANPELVYRAMRPFIEKNRVPADWAEALNLEHAPKTAWDAAIVKATDEAKPGATKGQIIGRAFEIMREYRPEPRPLRPQKWESPEGELASLQSEQRDLAGRIKAAETELANITKTPVTMRTPDMTTRAAQLGIILKAPSTAAEPGLLARRKANDERIAALKAQVAQRHREGASGLRAPTESEVKDAMAEAANDKAEAIRILRERGIDARLPAVRE